MQLAPLCQLIPLSSYNTLFTIAFININNKTKYYVKGYIKKEAYWL